MSFDDHIAVQRTAENEYRCEIDAAHMIIVVVVAKGERAGVADQPDPVAALRDDIARLLVDQNRSRRCGEDRSLTRVGPGRRDAHPIGAPFGSPDHVEDGQVRGVTLEALLALGAEGQPH